MTEQPRFQPPQYVERNRHARALARRPQPCMICAAWTKTALYPCGWHCVSCAASRGLQPVAEAVSS
jgi:hypothetical protein